MGVFDNRYKPKNRYLAGSKPQERRVQRIHETHRKSGRVEENQKCNSRHNQVENHPHVGRLPIRKREAANITTKKRTQDSLD
jgi:hypothetical protein